MELELEEEIDKYCSDNDGSSFIMDGILKSAIDKFVIELGKQNNQQTIINKFVNPLITHITTFMTKYIREQFYTQFMLIMAVILILFIINILLLATIYMSRVRPSASSALKIFK